MPRTDLREDITSLLAAFNQLPLPQAAAALFLKLGYSSDRTVPLSSAKQFIQEFDPGVRLTDAEKQALSQTSGLHLLFQLTNAEIDLSPDLFSSDLDTTRIESYLFFAVALPAEQYTRTQLSTLVRALNKPLAMPAIVLFKHGVSLSLGIIHRRLNKREQNRDVLEKVTLIKDIRLDDPIRAHVEILNDFVLANLDAEYGVSNFVRLHEAWQKRLGQYALSDNFYREIADWYFWAHHLVDEGRLRLPQHCDTPQEQSLFLIRLLTRIIFCWFLVEKRLIPSDLFNSHRLRTLLKQFTPSNHPERPDLKPTYYHAVLQNLFFGTLNMPPEGRMFRGKKKQGERFDSNYGITNLWRYEADFNQPNDWIALSAQIPFLNGGLFDCLDDKSGKKQDNSILDGFSDNEKLACLLPNDLFFGPERTVDLSRDYGEEGKRTARSKRAKVRGLIEILSRYKFTIEENTPLEEEIALDPELLGKVFENLLASYNEDTRTTARKALGAFYTPREIVSYMVDEALKSYLTTQVPRCKGALEDLFSNKATLKEIKPDTREALIAAIGRVKILDPACGSGAFPMGALHRLVDLLQKLDPNNEAWKRDRLAEARRYKQLLNETGAGKDELAACDARIADIEKSFDTRFHALDYARKLYLIENGIFGVDIQPIATQIAKLRFFIALVVDQKVNPKEKNLGVRPLPNLETRIVAADTLIPIEREESDFFSGDLDRLRDELATIRHEHFNARSPAAKRKWRDADATKRSELSALLQDSHSLSKDTARKLAAWDPYDQNTHAPFFDPEWMFGLKSNPDNPVGSSGFGKHSGLTTPHSGPFDIVIGNPPYISKQNFRRRFPEQFDRLKEILETTKGRDFDVFGCFIEKGLNILKPEGVLSIIVASGWYTGPAFGLLRRFVACHSDPLIIINLPYDVFEAAWVDTTILISRKRHSVSHWPRRESSSTRIRNFEKRDKIAGQIDFETGSDFVDIATWFEGGEDGFLTRSDSHIVRILSKIERRSRPLSELADIQRGVTPFNLTDRPSHKNSKPAFNGTVRRYRFDRGAKAFIRFDDSLAEFKPERYFTGRRILLRELISRQFELQAAVVEESFITNKSMQTILSNDPAKIEFLLGCINSRVMSWLFLQRSNVAHRDDFPKIVLKETRTLPIPHCSTEHMLDVGRIARVIDYLHNSAANTSTQNSRDPLMMPYWDQILNGLVYELYFPDELHAAGLHIFDLVEKAKLPDLDSIPAAQRLDRIRNLYETLSNPGHALRAALDKLQTLETVRIIEGRIRDSAN